MDALTVVMLAEELLGLGRRAIEAGTDVADEAVENAHQKAKGAQRKWNATVDKLRKKREAAGPPDQDLPGDNG